MAKNLYSEFVKSIKSDVMFTFKDMQENPNAYADWNDVGDKGVPFSFIDGETFVLPEKDKIVIIGREETIKKKKYPMLYTVIKSSLQGWVEVPLSIFRRIPALKEEIEILKKDNEIGSKLIPRQRDIHRLEKLVELAGINTVVVRECLLHKDGFDDKTNKPVKDDPSLEEKDRVHIMCYKFNLQK